MKVELELWQLITLLLAFMGCVAAFGKLLLAQIDKRLETKFAAQEQARLVGAASLRDSLDEYVAQAQKTATELTALERQFLQFKVELSREVVWREDYIRGQTVIEAKLDALYGKLEVVQLKGVKNVG